MNFSTFLASFFPHRWLDLKKGGTKKLLDGLGLTLTWLYDLLQHVVYESRVMTSIDTLTTREKEFGILPDPSLSNEFRRARIIAKTRELSGVVTKEAIALSLQSYGVSVEIENDYSNSIMKIKVLNVIGVPEGYDQIQAYIRNSVRAHVEVQFQFRFLSLAEIEAMTLEQVESTTMDNISWG
ncbi:putative phage tail protein [Bacillus sp. 3255]|uniref:putative phage tail protein n=1 Tax=Bacillus sp. 3255 TaxID=2817904 RepID=UPI00285E0655|nr:putative phage tail protein [Bacillus sp. 3255]MDR6883014.1 hypothetical protein [Bacillus sp. 3255]